MTKQPDRRFVAVMVSFAGIAVLTYREDVLGTLIAPLTLLTAEVTSVLLRWVGMEAARVATVVSHPSGFTYEIYYRCTGFLPAAVLTTAILASPGRGRWKLVGMVVGVSTLISLNLARLVHLFYVGVHQPAVFDFAHSVLWEGLVILAVVGLWLGWTCWAGSTRQHGPDRQPALAANAYRTVSIEPSHEPGVK